MIAWVDLKNRTHQCKVCESQFYKHWSVDNRFYQRVFLQSR